MLVVQPMTSARDVLAGYGRHRYHPAVELALPVPPHRAGVATLAVVAFVALLALTACDPCSGVAACRTAPTLALAGQMVDGTSGKPVRGVVITAHGARDASDGEGLWELSAPLDSATTAVDVTVQAPGTSAYTVKALPVRALTVRGDAQNVGRWITVPYARFGATLAWRGQPLAGATVSFAISR